MTVKDAEYSEDSKKMLEIDLKQEQETIGTIEREFVKQNALANLRFLRH